MNKKTIFITLTTIPSRLKNLKSTLTSLTNQNITKVKIILNIAKKYDRFPDEKIENIPKFITDEKKIIINYLDEDYGPISKLIGAIDYIKKNINTNSNNINTNSNNINTNSNNINTNSNNIFIVTVDDDMYYPPNFIFLLFSKIIENKENAVYGFMGLNLDINRNMFIPNSFDMARINILEGKGGIIYKYNIFDPELDKGEFMTYVKFCLKNQDCKYSDDIIISNWISKKGISKYLIFDKSYNRNNIESEFSLSYGNDKYSLKKPCDLLAESNIERYKNCINKLKKNKKLFFINDYLKFF